MYNGDVGIVWAVNENKLFVRYYEKEIEYTRAEWGDLQLAYASTVHKSQGSEYDTIILHCFRSRESCFSAICFIPELRGRERKLF